MAKRNKNVAADAEQPSREFSEYQSLLESEAFRDQGEPVSTVSLGGRREGTDEELARLSGGDPDVSPQGIDSGEETPGGSNPTPGQDLVDEIGGAVGLTYQDDEPLKFDEKFATRDEERWENNPASSEDYQERQITTESDAPGSIPSSNKKNKRRKSPRSDDGTTNQT